VQVEWDEAYGDSPFLLYGIVGDDVSGVEAVVTVGGERPSSAKTATGSSSRMAAATNFRK